MENFKYAKCKYCKMEYKYKADLREVICPNCNKRITTPTGAKCDFDRNLTTAAKFLRILLRL